MGSSSINAPKLATSSGTNPSSRAGQEQALLTRAKDPKAYPAIWDEALAFRRAWGASRALDDALVVHYAFDLDAAQQAVADARYFEPSGFELTGDYIDALAAAAKGSLLPKVNLAASITRLASLGVGTMAEENYAATDVLSNAQDQYSTPGKQAPKWLKDAETLAQTHDARVDAARKTALAELAARVDVLRQAQARQPADRAVMWVGNDAFSSQGRFRAVAMPKDLRITPRAVSHRYFTIPRKGPRRDLEAHQIALDLWGATTALDDAGFRFPWLAAHPLAILIGDVNTDYSTALAPDPGGTGATNIIGFDTAEHEAPALDVTVVTHEFGHAILDQLIPGIRAPYWQTDAPAGMGTSLDEGFADCFAALVTDTPRLGMSLSETSYGSPVGLRRLDGDVPLGHAEDPHVSGQAFSQSLWHLGRALVAAGQTDAQARQISLRVLVLTAALMPTQFPTGSDVITVAVEALAHVAALDHLDPELVQTAREALVNAAKERDLGSPTSAILTAAQARAQDFAKQLEARHTVLREPADFAAALSRLDAPVSYRPANQALLPGGWRKLTVERVKDGKPTERFFSVVVDAAGRPRLLSDHR